MKVGSQNPMFQKSIIKPLRINSKLGTYYLEGEDLLDQKTVEYPIIQNEDDEQFEPIAEAFVKLPEFKTRGQVLTIESINKKSIKALDKDAYWKIIYLNRNGILSTRTIYSPEISYTLKPQDFSNATAKRTAQDYYLKAICIRKNHSERHFLIDKIQSIEVLPLSAQSNFAKLKTPITTGRAKLPSGPKKSRTKTH
ncbi:MAG: hypothetical protein EOP04_25555 [Proteobacteria bacterium]|nr:MAG: hypothetical protein EOP04_25555 [Pseudomonadota bacterium]